MHARPCLDAVSEPRSRGHTGRICVGPGETRELVIQLCLGHFDVDLPSTWCHTGLVTLGQVPRQRAS